MRVCVLGGGVIGVTTAYYLARHGHQVTVLEQHDGVGLETSFANGGQLSYSYVAPLADPAVLPKLLGWLLKRESALRFVPRPDLRQWRWSLSFLRACRAGVARLATARLLALSFYSRSLLHALVREEALDFDYARNGKLILYRDPAEFEAAKRQMDYQATLGCEQQALNANACVALEPALAPLLPRLAGGIHTPSEDVGDCHKFVVELARVTREKYGATFHHGIKATGLRATGKRIAAVRTGSGDIEADAFVVALGMGSLQLLAPLGVSLPLYPLKGYSLTVPIDASHSAPRVSISDTHHKVVYAPLGERLRVAGMVDITGMSAKPDLTRLDLLARQARETFPNGGDYGRAQTWCGQRPATPSGKPLLGGTAYDNLWLNTGHGALGFTLACGSAQLVADCIGQHQPELDVMLFR